VEIGPFAKGRTVAKGREVTLPSEEGPTQVPDGAIGVAPRLALSFGPSPIATPELTLTAERWFFSPFAIASAR
jgi:hypothetical protein